MEHLGAEIPFEFTDSTFSRGRRPVLGWKDYLVRIMVLMIQIAIILVERFVAPRSEVSKVEKRKVKKIA